MSMMSAGGETQAFAPLSSLSELAVSPWAMVGLIATLSALLFFAYFVALPLVEYFTDRKGLRRYPTLHPLAGLSDIPFMLESQRGFRSHTLLEMHRSGNPVIRVGPNQLSYGSVSAIRPIYGHNTPTLKDQAYDVSSNTHRHLADVTDKPDHARKRRILASAFAAKNLEDWEYKIADKTERMLKQFDKHVAERPQEPLDFRAWANFFTIDTLADICVSEEMRTIDRGNDTVTAERIDGSTYEVGWRETLYALFQGVGDWVWPYAWYLTLIKISSMLSPFYAKIWRDGAGWNEIVHHITRRRWDRYVAGEKLNDIFAYLMEDKEGQPYNLEWGEVVAEINLATSGSSSTSNTISSIMLLLVQNPEAMSRLREELDGALDEDDVIAPYDKVKYLPYLRACIDEGLRLFPPISHNLPRKTPTEGMQIARDWIGGNVTVGISAYVAHRDPAAFPEPERFKPERWLGEEGKALQPNFIAFSAGARGCIGRPISYLQSSVLISTLVRRYDLMLFDKDFKESRRETMNLILGEVPLRIRNRV